MPIDLAGLARLSLTDPKAGAAAVLREAAGWPAPVLWQTGALVVLLSVILSELSAALTGGPRPPGVVGAVLANPLAMAAVQGVIFVIAVHATHRIGRLFGGQGGDAGALALVVWTQVLMLGVQAVQALAFIVMPGLGAMIGMASVVLFFWVFTNFVRVLHGFRSAGAVFVGIVASGLAIMFGVSMLLAFLGLLFPGAIPRV